jgi:hypothetical protein
LTGWQTDPVRSWHTHLKIDKALCRKSLLLRAERGIGAAQGFATDQRCQS